MGCIHSVDRFFQIEASFLGHVVQVNNAVFYKCKINIIDVNTALFGIRKLLQNDSGNLLFQKIVSLGLIVFVQCQIKIIALCRFNPGRRLPECFRGCLHKRSAVLSFPEVLLQRIFRCRFFRQYPRRRSHYFRPVLKYSSSSSEIWPQ